MLRSKPKSNHQLFGESSARDEGQKYISPSAIRGLRGSPPVLPPGQLRGHVPVQSHRAPRSEGPVLSLMLCCHPEILYFLTRTPHFHFALDSAPHCLQGLKELTSGGLQEALGPAMTGKWPLLCVSVFPPTEPWRQSRGPCDCGLLGRERKQGASMAGLPLGRCLNRTTAPGTPREALPGPPMWNCCGGRGRSTLLPSVSNALEVIQICLRFSTFVKNAT